MLHTKIQQSPALTDSQIANASFKACDWPIIALRNNVITYETVTAVDAFDLLRFGV